MYTGSGRWDWRRAAVEQMAWPAAGPGGGTNTVNRKNVSGINQTGLSGRPGSVGQGGARHAAVIVQRQVPPSGSDGAPPYSRSDRSREQTQL